MSYISFKEGLQVKLEPLGLIPDQVHVFEERQTDAINAALAAGRPLLIRGEPGTGKSQLARAAAQRLKRAYIQYVVDSQTESRDLLWHLDSITRLAEAQIAGALANNSKADRLTKIREELRIENFLEPGPLWWAFDWESASRQAMRSRSRQPQQPHGADPSNGCVLLIDELDKAETEVPNGLLDALGSGQIALPSGEVVSARSPTPLVIITTNEERALPDAFIRRCLVLVLKLPENDDALIELLMMRGAAHFPDAAASVCRTAAEMLADDRRIARSIDRRALPGQAEYLDLLRAVLTFHDDTASQIGALRQVAEYTLKKHEI